MVAELRHRRKALDSLDPESRWERHQFEDAFNAVREPVSEARRCASALSAERCTELANLHKLSLSHWIELIGLGIGRHESYDIGRNEIAFRNWEDDFIAASPIEWQAEMERDIEIAPNLKFPCTPAELVEFVDTTAIGIHCFIVPEAFRQALAATITSEHNRSDSNTSVGAPERAKATKPNPTEFGVAIPGKLPNVSAGRLAVKAAWEIELETGRTASRDDVMNRLQEWAVKGNHPETLIREAKEKRAIEWHTKDGKGKIYDIEACGKTIETWKKSRA